MASCCARGFVAFGALFLGAVSCMGATSPPAAGHELALRANGEIWGRGANEFGQVRPGSGEFVSKPQRLPLPAAKWVAVVGGGRHSLAVDGGGKVWAWGDNSSGQLGLGDTRPATKPAKVPGLPAKAVAVAVAAGAQHSAVLLADGSIWVWGANNQGQLGNGVTDAFAVAAKPRRVAGVLHALALAAGDDFVMVLAGKRNKTSDATNVVWGWGAGNGVPHLLNKVQTAAALEAHSILRLSVPEVSAAKPVVAPAPEVAMAPPPAIMAATPALPPPPTPVLAPAPGLAPARLLTVSGTVRLADAPMEKVQVQAEGAQCSATDKQGQYVCHVAAGWSGRVRLQRNNYRFSPSALSFQNLRSDAGQQDFAAIYDPR